MGRQQVSQFDEGNLDLLEQAQYDGALASLARSLVRSLEALHLRGAPTLLLQLCKMPRLRRAIAVAPLGMRKIVFPAFDAYWGRHLWAGAAYEPDVEQIFRKLGAGRALIDCGANIGYWSVRSPEFGFTCAVAVEANQELVPFLSENFRLNRIPGRAVHAAVYSSSGKQLYLGGTNAHAQGAIASQGMPVTSVTIADLCKDVAAPRGIVAKLDVEGAEIDALDGAGDVADIIFVYEDFVQHGMRVTGELLRRKMSIFGVSPEGLSRRISSVEDAIAFNRETATCGAPSNRVACSPAKLGEVQQDLTR